MSKKRGRSWDIAGIAKSRVVSIVRCDLFIVDERRQTGIHRNRTLISVRPFDLFIENAQDASLSTNYKKIQQRCAALQQWAVATSK